MDTQCPMSLWYKSEMLGENLKAARSAAGLKQREVADRLGVEQPTVQRWEAGKREPDNATLRRLAEIFGVKVSDLLGESSPPIPVSTALPAPMPAVPPGQWARDVPVVGGGLAAPLHVSVKGQGLEIEQTSLDFGADPDFAPRPPSFATNRTIYCVYVWGDSMMPRFDAGDRLYVDPRRPANVGEDVVVQLRADPNSDDLQVVVALIKKLVRRNGSTIELEQYNPATRLTIDLARVTSIHRIVPWRELL